MFMIHIVLEQVENNGYSVCPTNKYRINEQQQQQQKAYTEK